MDLLAMVRSNDDRPALIQQMQEGADIFIRHFIRLIDLSLETLCWISSRLLQSIIPKLMGAVINEVMVAEDDLYTFFLDQIIDGSRLPQSIEPASWVSGSFGKLQTGATHLGKRRHITAIIDDLPIDRFR